MNNNLLNYFSNLNKKEIIYTLMGKLPHELRHYISGMPDEDIQIKTTGKSGFNNILEALDFCNAVMNQYNKFPDTLRNKPRVLDFGCGWGRISRAFLTVTDANKITGVDVRPDIINLASQLTHGVKFFPNNFHPPLAGINNSSFDIIVAYSVFSHLPEDIAQSWISEFSRIVNPGGLVCITTRPKAHLTNAKKYSTNTETLNRHQKTYATMIENFDIAIEKFDAGEFVYAPTGGGGILTSNFYGESVIPRIYVEKKWSKYFELIDWVDSFSEVGVQPIIILKKKPFK